MLDLHEFPPSLAAPRRVSLASVGTAEALARPAAARPVPTGDAQHDIDARQPRRMAQMLDTLDYGMLLLVETDRVLHVNKAAWRDLDGQHPLQLAAGRLQARAPGDTAALREALQGAALRGLRKLLQLGEDAQRVSIAVVPLPPIDLDDHPGVAVLLGKRQVCEALTVDWFARSRGLTLAETAVLKGLCDDLTPQQIAQRQGVGLATIRTQIGSIRHKTGAGSIRALVRQVAVLPPLVSALQGVPLAGAGVAPVRLLS